MRPVISPTWSELWLRETRRASVSNHNPAGSICPRSSFTTLSCWCSKSLSARINQKKTKKIEALECHLWLTALMFVFPCEDADGEPQRGSAAQPLCLELFFCFCKYILLQKRSKTGENLLDKSIRIQGGRLLLMPLITPVSCTNVCLCCESLLKLQWLSPRKKKEFFNYLNLPTLNDAFTVCMKVCIQISHFCRKFRLQRFNASN